MHPIARSLLGVLAGAFVAGLVIFAIQALNLFVYPPPPGFDMNDPAAVAAFVGAAPASAMLVVLASYAAGTVAGAWVAARVAGHAHAAHGLIIGALFLLAGIWNVVTLPHPLWFVVACLGIFLPAGWFGGQLAARPPAPRG